MLSVLLALAALTIQAPPLLLHDVHVVDVEQGTVLEHQAVLVRGGRIERVAPASELRAPPEAERVEGGGRYLVPGLVDAHVHFFSGDDEDDLWLYLANGVTTVRSMHDEGHALELRARVAAGTLVGPRILTTGPTTAQVKVTSEELARSTARAQKAAGYDALKMYGDGADSMTRATYHALVTTAHELGLPVVGHAPRNLPFSAVLEERQDSIDHMEEVVYTAEELAPLVRPFVDVQFGRTPIASRPTRVPDFARELAPAIEVLAGKVAAAGLCVTPTLTTFGSIAATLDDELLTRLARPELAYVSPARRRQWTPERARFRQGSWGQALPFMAEYLRANLALQRALTRAFHAHGVPILTGTDAPFDLVVQGFALHDELDELVRSGLTPLDALRAATLTPARAWKLAESGSIAPGMRADLVLVARDPRGDVRALREPDGVVAAGRWFPRERLAAELARLSERQARRAPWVERIAAALDDDDARAAVGAWQDSGELKPALAPFLENGLNVLGYVHLRAGRMEKALAILTQNSELFPASVNAWDSLGECLWRLDRDTEAIAAYEQALELDPGASEVRAKIERILEEP